MQNLLDTLLNGPSRWTQEQELGDGMTIVVVLGVLAIELAAAPNIIPFVILPIGIFSTLDPVSACISKPDLSCCNNYWLGVVGEVRTASYFKDPPITLFKKDKF